ncbi:MAG: hypothetical protein WA755_02590 [Candidatus Acidiferrales bacterium]
MRAEIRGGRAIKERKLAVSSGSIPLSPEDRAELFAILAADIDPDVAKKATANIAGIPAADFIAALARADADARVFSHCATKLAEQGGIADALAKNPACPRPLIARAAKHLSSAGIQSLLDDLDGLTISAELAVAIGASPNATAEQRELIAELKRGAPDEKEVHEAVAAAEPDPERRRTLLQQITTMTVVERIQLAIKGPREARTALIRDNNKIVQRAVLQSPRLTDADMESFATMTNLSGEVLRLIATNRKYIKNYMVARNLTYNPKTPLDISLRLIVRLTGADMKLLATNKNIPETLRSLALKLHRQRSSSKPSE